MKKLRAYLLFFLVILLLSSIGVAAEKAVKNIKAEFVMSLYVPAGETVPLPEAVPQPISKAKEVN